MTIQLQMERGRVALYGAFDIQNPNSAFHSLKLESTGSVYVAPEDNEKLSSTNQRLSKRLAKRIVSGGTQETSNTTLYVSIEGQEDLSSFTLKTTFGDTCKFIIVITEYV